MFNHQYSNINSWHYLHSLALEMISIKYLVATNMNKKSIINTIYLFLLFLLFLLFVLLVLLVLLLLFFILRYFLDLFLFFHFFLLYHLFLFEFCLFIAHDVNLFKLSQYFLIYWWLIKQALKPNSIHF